MKEIWKDIKDYEELYQISNYGRVKSLYRYVDKTHIYKEKIMKNHNDGRNYYDIQLTKNGTRKTVKIHRLVAEAFVPNPNNYKWVNHKDENPSNNYYENLEWCTPKYNANYGTNKERISKKLSKKINQYNKDGEFIKQWNSSVEIFKALKIRHTTECCNNQRKIAGGYIWRFADD